VICTLKKKKKDLPLAQDPQKAVPGHFCVEPPPILTQNNEAWGMKWQS